MHWQFRHWINPEDNIKSNTKVDFMLFIDELFRVPFSSYSNQVVGIRGAYLTLCGV